MQNIKYLQNNATQKYQQNIGTHKIFTKYGQFVPAM